MNICTEWNDYELGKIQIRTNNRAKRLVMRILPECILMTVPPGTTQQVITDCINRHRIKLKKLREKCPDKHINLNYSIKNELFQLTLSTGPVSRFMAKSSCGKMNIICPPETDFNDEQLQTWLHKVIKESMRKNAQAQLPARLQRLANQWGLTYDQVRINASKGRWGSCSTKKHINLSLNLLLLPSHLIDYVLLHELAHTIEMNHGQKFWNLLNKMTEQRAHQLQKELKNYHPKF